MNYLTTTLTVFLCILARAESSSHSLLQMENTFWEHSLPHTQSRLRQFLTETEAKLPKDLLLVLPSPIIITFQLELAGTLTPPDCSLKRRREFAHFDSRIKSLIAAEPNSNTLVLNQDFFSIVLATETSATSFPCDWKNMYRWAQSEVINGVLQLASPHYGHAIQSPVWLNLLRRYEPNADQFNDQSLSRSWIQYASHYLVDPEFTCRLPNLSRYFDQIFKVDLNIKKPTCQLYARVLTSTSKKLINLDYRRLYQIHILSAGSGLNFESRWGHTAFRLIFCNSKRTSLSADCLKDLNDHIVVSFMGTPTSPLISAWDGLNGNYPSQLVIDDFASVLNQYTKIEDRSLTSLPLNYSKQELVNFLERVLEEYWTYRGQYYFLSNNCAHEALRLLQSVTPERMDLSAASPWITTPVALIESLHKINLVPDTKRSFAGSNNIFYFPSVSETNTAEPNLPMNNALPSSQPNAFVLPIDDTANGLGELAPQERRKHFETQIKKNPMQKQQLAEQYYKIELDLYRTKEKQIDATLQRILDGKITNPSANYKKQIYAIFLSRRALTPAYLAGFDYGIPLENEVYPDIYIQRILDEIQTAKANLRELLKQDRPHLFAYLNQTNQNMIYLYQFLKPAIQASNKEKL